jgi:hypothetical protein
MGRTKNILVKDSNSIFSVPPGKFATYLAATKNGDTSMTLESIGRHLGDVRYDTSSDASECACDSND